MRSNESAEDYLETILLLSKKLPVVRSVDIANELEFKKSSVSVAMKKLRESGKITVTDSGYIYLTDEGKELAERVYERHTVFTEFLTSLGVAPDVAENDACRIEHIISEESFQAFKRHIETS
ncbi:MAG: metal-dependent transcriptional regulator [Eubacterium sp.]|nr:metal-dependent transcriptional regulator [Eubacterium sp.]